MGENVTTFALFYFLKKKDSVYEQNTFSKNLGHYGEQVFRDLKVKADWNFPVIYEYNKGKEQVISATSRKVCSCIDHVSKTTLTEMEKNLCENIVN